MALDSKLRRRSPLVADDAEPMRARLDQLARRYYAPLISFFRKRTHNLTQVEDLVQQVFVRLAQYREFDRVQNAEGYIFQTAANTLKDYARNARIRERFASQQIASEQDLCSEFSPERVLLGREEVALLAQALRQLPERTRDIFMLRCFEGLKHAEIAQLQSISIRSVEKHLAKALSYLGATLEREAGE